MVHIGTKQYQIQKQRYEVDYKHSINSLTVFQCFVTDVIT